MYKILVVEDEAPLRLDIAKYLSHSNFEIFTVTEFDNIIKDFNQFDPNLVLLDVNLPTFDGYYWCQKIRDHSKVPIIVTASRSARLDVALGVNIGADDYLYKPYDFDELLEKIHFLLESTDDE